LGKRRHLSAQCEVLRIEGLHHKGSIADKEQMAGRFVFEPGVDLQDRLAFSAVDGCNLDLALRRIGALSKKQELFSVRKKVGKPVPGFLPRLVRRTKHTGHSTAGGDAIQRTPWTQRKNYDVLRTPGSLRSIADWRITQDLSRAAIDGNFLQFAPRKKT